VSKVLKTSSIVICHPRAKIERLFPDDAKPRVINVTSKAELPWKRFSPFFPHGGIPIPFWSGRTAQTVEGIWQGLKRFENEDCVDTEVFENRSMAGLKRTGRACGKLGTPRGRVLGHQCGEHRDILLDYLQARVLIYLPCYKWVLDKVLGVELEKLRSLASEGKLVLLDYSTNGDVSRMDKPLSHAALIRAYLENAWPEIEVEIPDAVRHLRAA
jgi:hypothetical protein